MSEAKEKQKQKQQGHKGGAPGAKGEKQQKQPKKPKAAAVEAEQQGGDEPQAAAPPPRLAVRYHDEIIPSLKQKLGYKNLLAVPRLEKIVISMGLGKAVTSGEKGKMEQAEKELGVIAGQRPVRCKAKKSVSNFKVREGQETGLKVTLRGNRMYEFLDRLITLAIPRVKDFRGLNPKGFDGAGNYNFGFTEQTVFPEVSLDTMTFQQGMNITVVTTANSIEEGKELLKHFGMPFGKDGKMEK